MSGDGVLDDQGLLARLGTIAQKVDGPPELAYQLGRAAFAWRHAESELAQLMADSALESALVRSAALDTRLLSFAAEGLTIEIQVTIRRGTSSLIGQILPEPSTSNGVVRLEPRTGPARLAPLDAVGRFEIDDVPADLVRLRIDAPDGTAVTTVWFSL